MECTENKRFTAQNTRENNTTKLRVERSNRQNARLNGEHVIQRPELQTKDEMTRQECNGEAKMDESKIMMK